MTNTVTVDAQGNIVEEPATPPVATGRSYAHVSRLLHERPWAVQPTLLRYMADLVQLRAEGHAMGADEIRERVAAARAEGGDRNGPALAGSVAIIPLYGLISQRTSLMSEYSGGTSIDELRGTLYGALADPAVKAVVFDIDSPGGSVDAVPEFAAELRKVRTGAKPIVGQVNTLAASAAYWLASSMSEIAMTPSGEVGSIGVYAAHQDVSKAAEMEGVKTTLISAGTYKVEGNPYEPLTDEAKTAIQDQVDAFYAMFLADVAAGRKTSAAKVAAGYGEGRTLLAPAALAAGMVDGIATLDATVERLNRAVAAPPARRAAEVTSIPIAASVAAATKPDPAWNAKVAKLMRSTR